LAWIITSQLDFTLFNRNRSSVHEMQANYQREKQVLEHKGLGPLCGEDLR
jgi:hypothetical protein